MPITRNPQVTLWKEGADGTFLVLAEQERLVRDSIRDLLGYTAEEFRRVVLLPQGRFRELLVAAQDPWQSILATLFSLLPACRRCVRADGAHGARHRRRNPDPARHAARRGRGGDAGGRREGGCGP